MIDLSRLDFTKGGGLVTVVAQDARTGAVLMVAHADREALERTVATGEMHYRSRTRGLWHKGATSGNVQRVVSLAMDCDGDAVLARVAPAGPACHTGSVSCFGAGALTADALGVLAATIEARVAQAPTGVGEPAQSPFAALRTGSAKGPPPSLRSGQAPSSKSMGPSAATPHLAAAHGTDSPQPSYTRRLLDDRNLRLKKIGEEAAELITACADGDAERAAEEGADVFYHALVALRAAGVTLDDVRRALERRREGREKQ